jgi:hypothetical protein
LVLFSFLFFSCFLLVFCIVFLSFRILFCVFPVAESKIVCREREREREGCVFLLLAMD